MRISDWSSDVCSSDLSASSGRPSPPAPSTDLFSAPVDCTKYTCRSVSPPDLVSSTSDSSNTGVSTGRKPKRSKVRRIVSSRSEKHTSELQSLMRISYAVFCLKKKNKNSTQNKTQHTKIS